MTWTYTYKMGDPGSTGTPLSDFCYDVRITSEAALGFRGRNPVQSYQHGEFSSPRKFHPAANLLLETFLRYTSSTGGVTHTDGRPGHVYQNFGSVKKLVIGKQGALARLFRTAPEEGAVYRDVELVAEGRPTQANHIIGWPLRAPFPFWVGTSSTGNSPPTLTNAGTAPVGDAVIDFTGTATAPRLTHDDTTDYIEITGALPAGGVRIDVGARTCVKITGGADYSDNLVVNTPWWLELDPGANAVTVTQGSGTPTVSVDWVTPWL